MSFLSEPPFRYVTLPAATAAALPSHAEVAAAVPGLLALAVSTCLKSGLVKGEHTFRVQVAPGRAPEEFTIAAVPSSQPPHVAVPASRAAAFRVPGRDQAEVLAGLRAFDQPRPEGKKRRVPFYRDSHRLDALVQKSGGMVNPTVVVSNYQLPDPFSFGGGPAPPERPLKYPILGAADRAARMVPLPGYGEAMAEAVELGDYTTHDPDTLHPRFLHYVNERITSVDERTALSLRGAMDAQRGMWEDSGVRANAARLSDVDRKYVENLVNRGSPGEYRAHGVQDRRDPRMCEVMATSLQRYGEAGRRVFAGKRVPAWVSTTCQPTLSFGKEEPKAAKRRQDGSKEPPVPRFIFNLSPINYALCAFLHSDLSHQLQERDVTHGPGFGAGRGRSSKFLSVVEGVFGGANRVSYGDRMVMSDIAKWDANIREVLLGATYDNMELSVRTEELDGPALCARRVMSQVSRRQLLEKLVEHPSGYLTRLFGSMPSGSYYTSLVNTNANNLLLLGHLIDRAAAETEYTVAGAAEEARRVAPGLMVSYGDNQLFSARLFGKLGIDYDPAKHAEYLARFGMELKLDETEVTQDLARVRFCSRAVVRTPEGLLITRTHTALAAKLAARPEHDPVVDKLYVRAIMADYMGTDPVAYDMMAAVDRQIDVDVEMDSVTPKTRPVLAAAAKSLLGDDRDESLLVVLGALAGGTADRRALLSLHTPRGEATRKEMSLGSSHTVGATLFGGPLTPAANWALGCGAREWGAYLQETGQLGILID